MVAVRIASLLLLAAFPASVDAYCMLCFPTACPLSDGTQKACTEDEPYYHLGQEICSSDCSDEGGAGPTVIDGSSYGALDTVDGQTGYYDDGTFTPLTPYDVYEYDGTDYDYDDTVVVDNDGTWDYEDGDAVYDDGVWEGDASLAARKMQAPLTSIILAAGAGVIAGVFAVTAAVRFGPFGRKTGEPLLTA